MDGTIGKPKSKYNNRELGTRGKAFTKKTKHILNNVYCHPRGINTNVLAKRCTRAIF